MAEKDFRVRKGLVVDGTASATSVAVTTGNVVVSSGTIGVTDGPLLSIVAGSPNISLISSSPTNGNLKLSPNGSGDLIIDADTIDLTADSTILKVKDNVAAGLDIKTGDHSYIKLVTTNGSEQITFGRGSTFNGTIIADLGTVSAATSITATDLIGTNIDGIIGADTARAGTFAALTGTSGTLTSLTLTEGNITNAGDINADSISVDAAAAGLNVDFSAANTGTGVITLRDAMADALSITDGTNDWMVFNTNVETLTFGRNTTFAGTTIADLGTVTTADINAGTWQGTIDGAWTASGVTCANLGTVSAATSITSTALVGGTISGTTIDATTDFTIGSTVITDDSIVMTPTTGDTLSITSTTHGASTIATVDAAGSLLAPLNIDADGVINLKYNSNTKVVVGTGGIDVTGKMDATGTVSGGGFNSTTEQASAGTGIDLHSTATIRAKEDGGIYQDISVIALSGTKLTSINMENSNFRASDTNTVTAAIGAGSVHTIAYINLDNSSNNKYHAVEVECGFQEKITSTNVRTRWLSQKLYACYDGNTVEFRTDNTRFTNSLNAYPPGEFCAGLYNDGSDKYLSIGFCIYAEKSSTDRTATFGVNMNGISMPVCLNS
jgi:hypothetical protein